MSPGLLESDSVVPRRPVTAMIPTHAQDLSRREKAVLGLMGVGLGLATVDSSLLIGVTLLLAGVGLVVAYQQGNTLLSVLLAGFFVRVLVVVVDSQLALFPQPPIAQTHDGNAQALIDAVGQAGPLPTFRDGLLTIVAYAHAPFYVIFGQWDVAGRLGAAFYGTLVGLVTYHIAARVTTHRVALGAAAVTLFWPTLIYRSVVIQREVLMAIAMLTVVAIGVRWVDRISPGSVVLLVVLAALVAGLRPENLLLVGLVPGVALFVRGLEQPRYLGLGAVLVVPAVALVVLNFGAITNFGTVISPAAIDEFAHGRAHGDAAYLTAVHYRSYLDILFLLPVKLVYFLFSPLPWQIGSSFDLAVGLVAWLGIGVVVLALRGSGQLVARRHRKQVAVLLAYLVVGITAYAIIEMNYGAAVRRRIQFLPVLFVLASVALSHVSIRVGEKGKRTRPADAAGAPATSTTDTDT